MRFPLVKPGLPMANLLTGYLAGAGLRAPARADRRTKNLTRRLHQGEIAVIDHIDLDGPAAEALAACKVRAVVNMAPSISGRYPNRGPEVLLDAGISLIDCVGSDLISTLIEGEVLTLQDGAIYRGEERLGSGQVMTPERLAVEIAAARRNLDTELRRFVSNTLSFVEQESGLLFEAANLPNFRLDLHDRHVLVVVRGEGARQDLSTIRGYIRERKPVLIGVDGGADLLLEQGFCPDIIFGDMDSISDGALQCGAQIIVHAYPDGRCPGKARMDALGIDCHILPSRGTSEDVVLLAAYEKGAELIIAVGTHFNLIDFLDKNRGGMSSTFLVRLRVGSRLVDAKGVSRLYRVSYPLIHFSVMILAGVIVIALIVLLSEDVQSVLQFLVMRLQRMLGF